MGRAAEIDRVCRLLASGRGVVLAGPAGVGKTRLALACLEQVERAGLATARATATRAASGLPFGALAPLLPPMHLEGLRVDDRAELLRRSALALVEQAPGRRLLVLVDDAHLLDETSAVLIHQLASTHMASVLLTLRTGEPAPDPVTALWKDGLLERHELEGLKVQAIEEVLTAALNGPVDLGGVHRLAVASQGNMLFLRELVQGSLEDGSLCFSDEVGIWRLVDSLSPSERLVELVEARLGRLDQPEQAILEIVSVGEPLGPAELEALADPALIECLERRGLLSSRREGRRLQIRLSHPIYGDVLRARIPGLRARAIARCLAEVVEVTGARRRDDTLRVATWRLEGGGAQPDLMLAGAIAARWHYEFPLAERLARAALDAGAGFDAALLSAELAVLQGRVDEAEAQLRVLATQAADDSQRGRVAMTRLENYIFHQGRIEEGLRLAEEAEAAIQDPSWRDEILAKRSGILLANEGPRAGAEAAEPLVERTHGRALVWSCVIAAASLTRIGRLDAAIEATIKGRAADEALAGPSDPWTYINFQCDALLHAGRIDDAEALAYTHYQQSLAERSLLGQAFFAWAISKSALARGRVETSARYGREAVALCRQLGRPQVESLCLPALALALALSNRAEEAAELLTSSARLRLPSTLYMATDPLEAQAWIAVASGDLRLARRLLEQAADLGMSAGDTVGAAAAFHGLARLGQARAVLDRLATIAGRIDGTLAQARVAHTRGLAERDAAGLDHVSVAFESLGADLLAAEASADAAVSWRRTGQGRNAAAAERRALALAARCEGATTPALQAIEARARLTSAERDAVVLAANGHSNKEISEQLHLSVRTVETYLQRAYEKLGVNGRSELAVALTLMT